MDILSIPTQFAQLHEQYERLEKSFKELKEAQSISNFNPFERLTRKDIKEQYCISYGTIHNLRS